MSGPASLIEPAQVEVDDSLFLDGPPRPEDASAHRRFAVDPEASRFCGWTAERARTQPDAYYDKVVRQLVREWREGRTFHFTIRRGSDGVAVGSVELRPGGDLTATIFYLVSADLRRQGIATRAVEALLAWAAETLALRQVELTCHVENVASRRVAEKCGFSFLGRNADQLRFRRDLDPNS